MLVTFSSSETFIFVKYRFAACSYIWRSASCKVPSSRIGGYLWAWCIWTSDDLHARTRFIDISDELAGDSGGDSGMDERLGDCGEFTSDKGGDVKGDDSGAVQLLGDCIL